MKRFTSLLLSCLLIMSMVLAGCGGKKEEPAKKADTSAKPSASVKATTAPTTAPSVAPTEVPKLVDDPNVKVIKIASYSNLTDGLIKKYKELHPEFPYEIQQTIQVNTITEYIPDVNKALKEGGDAAPDLYIMSLPIAAYTKGEYAKYAADLKKDLGIDVDTLAKEADIAPYTVEAGTNKEGNVVGLGITTYPGAYFYRRSIAKEVWGTDDPAAIKEKISSWDNFLKAAKELKAKGYGIVSSLGEVWKPFSYSSNKGWIVDGKLNIEPKSEEYLDFCKKLYQGGYTNNTVEWQEKWFDDMQDKGDMKIFGYFGSSYLATDYSAFTGSGSNAGDWAFCEPTDKFFMDGTWVFANKKTKVPSAVAELIKWMALDGSKTGYQYYLASGTLENSKEINVVASGTAMEACEGKLDIIGGQDMFKVFGPISKQISAANLTEYDEQIEVLWKEQANKYAAGKKSKDQAIADFKKQVKKEVKID